MQMKIILKQLDKAERFSQTRQRRLLLDIIRQVHGHIDAKELFRRAVEKDASISHATVYRTLNLFKQLGLVTGNRFGKAQCYYEAAHTPEHQHLVCKECGRVIDFTCPLKEIIGRVKKEQGFTVTKAEVYLEGYCSDCAVK